MNLAVALRARRAIIADQESRRDQQTHMARLAEISAEIENIETSLPEPIDPRLASRMIRSNATSSSTTRILFSSVATAVDLITNQHE